MVVFYDCSFCPLDKNVYNDQDDKKYNYNKFMWFYLVLISLKFSLVLLYHVVNEYIDLNQIISTYEKKYLSL